MPRVGDISAVRWRTDYSPPTVRLLAPDVPRPAGSGAPARTARVVGPGLLDVPFSALAAKAQRLYDADPNRLDALSLELIEEAEARLDAEGLTYRHTKTTDGYFALQIEGRDDGHLLAGPAHDLVEHLGGFRLLYSPGKLLARKSNGDHWRFTREVCFGHASIQDMRLDPVTVHEMEHAVLSRAEEKGIPQLFTGSFQANPGGSIPTDSHGIGGYVDYLSVQEVAAYAEQCYVHANRITAVDFEPDYVDEVGQVKEMASWGAAIAERVGGIAEQLVGELAKAPPVHAKFDDVDAVVGADALDDDDVHVRVERFPLTIQPFGADTPEPAGDPRVFVQIRGLPFSSSIPLPQAEAAVEAGDYLAVRDHLSDHFTRLADGCERLQVAFTKVWDETKRLQGTRPLERTHLDRLVEDVLALRALTKSIATDYRNTFDPPPA